MTSEKSKDKTRIVVALGVLVAGSLIFLSAVRLGGAQAWEFRRSVSCETAPPVLNESIRNFVNWPKFFRKLEKARRISVTGQEFPVIEQDVEAGALVRITLTPDRDTNFSEDPLVTPLTSEVASLAKSEFEMRVVRYVPEQELVLALDTDLKHALRGQFRDLKWEIRLQDGKVSAGVSGYPESTRARILGTVAYSLIFLPVAFFDPKALCAVTQPRPKLLVPAFQR